VTSDYRERTRIQSAALIGAVALLGLLLLGGGWLVIRGLTNPAGVPVEQAHEVAMPTAEGTMGVPDFVDGVPWGFALDPAGAAAAGLTAVAVTGQPEVAFDPERFLEVAEVVFTPEEAATQARQVDAARTQFELSGWAEQPATRRIRGDRRSSRASGSTHGRAIPGLSRYRDSDLGSVRCCGEERNPGLARRGHRRIRRWRGRGRHDHAERHRRRARTPRVRSRSERSTVMPNSA